jgi:parvulin-like peptidyl-prolyl isomerase
MLIATYGNDPGMADNPDGYTFASGAMVAEFEETTRNLKIGEISEPFHAHHGIHIVMRVEPNPDNVMRAWWLDESEENDDEELLAAKHILILVDDYVSLEERQIAAIISVFERRAEEAVLEFLPALYQIEVPDDM